MTDQQDKDDLAAIMRRVEKLLAIAGDDRANPAEAAAAAGMAERIMRKYQLDHATIILASLRKGDDMDEVHCVAKGRVASTDAPITRVPMWAQFLSVPVAKLNDCVLKIRSSGDNASIVFQGFSSDVKVAGWMFDYLVAATNRLCLGFRASREFAVYGRKGAAAYRQGVVSGILSSLKLLIEEKLADQQQTSTGRELVVVKSRAVAEHFGAMKLKSVKQNTSVGSAYRSGRVDGARVKVGTRALGSNGGGSPLLLK